MAYLVAAGLPPLVAMRAATSVGADLLRLDMRGRLKAGHVADMLLVEGDPTADIAAAADRGNHRSVYKDGRAVI
jgi:imidazolonepropionase-like amidohydrolase